MTKIFLLLVVLWLHGFASAQQRLTFHSQNYVGMLEGEAGTSVQLHTVNGLQYRKWFGGIGAGLDYYYFRSIPLFLSLNRDLNIKRNKFYFSADGGINFPWVKNTTFYWAEQEDFSPSHYWAGGMGYKLAINKQNRLLLHIGYSYKHMIQETQYEYPCLIPPCPVSKQRYDYYLKRLSLKAGWMF